MSSPTRSPAATETNEAQDSSVNAIVDLRLPPFRFTEPRIWFAIIEPLFATLGIKSQIAKYGCVLAALPTEVLADISDLIDSAPADH